MNYQVFKSVDAIGQAAAILFSSQVLQKKNCVLGLATGSTPIPTYEHMIKLYRNGIVDYSRVTTYNLDEYCGLSPSHEQSYHFFMMSQLFQHINIPKAQIHVPNGQAANIQAECEAYDAAIERDGGIDLQLLGLGTNGHIAFNEPGETFVFGTHQTALTEDTIKANQRFFSTEDDVPRQAITMGVGTIMKARAIVLLATGKNKAAAVRNMIQGAPSPACPASVLQFHPHVTVLLDEDAASLL